MGAIAFGVVAWRHHGERFGHLWGGLSDRRVMSADMRRRNAEYRKRYADAVRAGEAPPTPPPGSFNPGFTGGGVETYVRLSYWALRIGLAIVATAGAYATLGQVLTGRLGSIFLRGLFGS